MAAVAIRTAGSDEVAVPGVGGIRAPGQNHVGVMVVLGIDPGVASTGFGVVRVAGRRRWAPSTAG